MKPRLLALKAALSALVLFSFGGASAQYVQTFRFTEDLKQYSSEMVPSTVAGGNTDEVAMAGTIYDFNGPGGNVIHFVRLNGKVR